MSRIGVLVIGANAPKILGRVLDLFVDARFRFFLHVDAKLDLAAYLKHMDPAAARVTLVEPRVRVFWGGYSMIEAEIALINTALADATIDRLVLCSDDTVPLRGPDAIYDALMATPDRIAHEVRNYTQEWYTKFHFGDSNFSSFTKHLESRGFEPSDWENIQRLQRFVERGKKKLDRVYFSRQWWALGRDSVTTMLRRLDEDEHLRESFRYSIFSDEILFATLYQLCFPGANTPDVPMFADYERPPVPFVYTRPQDLPALDRVPAHCFFLRKIWPWNTGLVERIAKDWEPARAIQPMLMAAPVEVSTATRPADEGQYRSALAAAIEAREDGELEESARLFEALRAGDPGDAELCIEHVATLRKLRRLEEADRILDGAMALHPDHFGLYRSWADQPTRTLDHDEVIRRGEVLLAKFPASNHPAVWHNLAMMYGSYSEALRWEDLRVSIVAMTADLLRHGHGFRIGLWQATELCLTDQIKIMIEQAEPEAWRQLPHEAKLNARLRNEMAILNRRLVTAADVRVISIGQNCLPYLLGGRWGLVAGRERAEAATPFDRGAFHKDNAATVIDTDFETFSDRAAFCQVGVYDGSNMYKHDATGVNFYHERGPFWLANDGDRFFTQLERMLKRWRTVSATGRRLFVYALCGEGNLDVLVAAMERRLLGADAHLLIVDVMQTAHPCPVGAHVTYLHVPYPTDYTWDNFQHQSAARGLDFELAVMEAIVAGVSDFMPAAAAAAFAEERRKLLHGTAHASARWKNGHDNTSVLFGALHRADPASLSSSIGYAKALRDNGRLEAAQSILAPAKVLHPDSYEMHWAWAEIGVAPFDWREKLVRLHALLAAFPPAGEPRSWGAVAQELKTLNEHGAWEEAVALIESHWAGYTTRPDLFQSALATFVQLGHFTLARYLIAAAAPPVVKALPQNLAEHVLQRLTAAETNRAVLLRHGAEVITLGQDGLPTMLMMRWGLTTAPRSMRRSTPFELGDFYGNAAADAIADDFAAMLDRQAYVEKPAWGGGMTLRHVPSDVAFLVHRNAATGPAERERFFGHLDEMVLRWQEVKRAGTRVFVHFHTGRLDTDRLVAVLRAQRLIGGQGKLVVVDLNAEPTPVEDPDVVFKHAPLPKNYPWFNSLGVATPEGMAYEEGLAMLVVDLVKDLARVPRVDNGLRVA